VNSGGKKYTVIVTDGRKIERPLTSKTALATIDDYINSKVIDILSADDAVFFNWLQKFNASCKYSG
jgi:hypothetical protein